ncbi:MAG: hypothetical protein NTZ34_03155 [Chloroflexi bacterium]|nr:hypothetical protein [Chloroflexota bacterium]
MVFKSPFKPKGNLGLQSQDTILPGATLPLEIRVTPEEEVQPREVRAELTGEETYYATERHYRNGHYETHTVTKTNTFAKINQTLAEQPTLFKGVEQKWNCSLQLPPDAPPSCRGEVVNICWTLKAVLDVPKRADLSQEKPLKVVCPAPQMSENPAMPAENSYKEAALILKAPQVASTGSTLKGQLTLQVKDKVSIRSIRVELVKAEKAGVRGGDKVVSTTQISGTASYNQSESPSFEFSLDIPAEAPPTVLYGSSNLHWKVKAVIDRKMTTDFNVEQELFVYNAPKVTAK